MSADSGIFLLDTNIISQLMRDGRGAAAQQARAAIESGRAKRLCTSVVVHCELLFELAKRESARLRAAYDIQMNKLKVRAFGEKIAGHYADVGVKLERLGTPIGADDLFITAHALALGATLVTDNEDEFRRVPGLVVENWLR